MNPIKTKSKMKKTMKKFLSIAALALMGAVMTGCSSDDDSFTSNQQQFENKSKVVTLTTTVSLDGSAGTRALTSTGVKTFAAGETMAVIYHNGSSLVKAESNALTDGDITNEGRNATFTFDLETPDKSVDVTYIYPAAMANADGTINYDALETQDGTLATIANNLDLATYTAEWAGDNLPTATLNNQLAILAITLKDNATTPNDLTSSTTGLTIKDGTNHYSVSRSAVAGPIYVAIHPTTSANITITATDGTKKYGKYLTSKTYDASNGYTVNWEMYKMAASAEAGDMEKLLCTAGHIHADEADAKCTATRVAKIFYVGSETCESAYGFTHGLALGLTDASTGCAWGPMSTVSNAKQYNDVTFQPESGLMYNSYSTDHNNDNYPAFKNAIAYNSGVAPAECSDWFLPSAYQLQTMITAVGGHVNLREKANLDYTAATGYYWVCTETGTSLALRYYFGDGNFYYVDKNGSRRVRAALAF